MIVSPGQLGRHLAILGCIHRQTASCAKPCRSQHIPPAMTRKPAKQNVKT